MNNFNKKCLFCNVTIDDEDEKIKCSKCSNQYHQKCWDIYNGCYDEECILFHARVEELIDCEDISMINTEVESSTYCTNCGHKNKEENKFCINCGTKVKEESNYKESKSIIQKNSYKSSINNRDMERFIQKNTEYYISKFDEIITFGKQTSWNWSAFLVPAYWAIYRKMYAVGAILLGVNILLPFSLLFMILANLVCSVGFGIYGNYMYFNHINKKLANLSHLDSDARETAIKLDGGVNLALAIGIPIVISILLFLFVIILGGLTAMLFYGY